MQRVASRLLWEKLNSSSSNMCCGQRCAASTVLLYTGTHGVAWHLKEDTGPVATFDVGSQERSGAGFG